MRLQRVRVDHGRDGVGRVVEAVHELEAKRNDEGDEQQEKRQVGRDRRAGIADVDVAAASRLAEACGSRVLSLDQTFAADAVLIGSPTPTHADYIERAAAVGRAIFCEKKIGRAHV